MARIIDMLSWVAQGAAGRARRPAILLLRLEGVGRLVARFGGDEADLICQSLQARMVRSLGPRDRLVAQNGNEFCLALTGDPDRKLMSRAAILQRGCEAPVLCGGRKVSLRVTAVLAQGPARMRAAEERLASAARAHLEALPPSRHGALWVIDVDSTAADPAPARNLRAAPLLSEASTQMRPLPDLSSSKARPVEAPRSARHLTRALREGGLELWFLPIYCCATGVPAGFEARPRWRHPRLGLSGTAAFQSSLDPDARGELTRQLLVGAADALATLTRQGQSRAVLSLSVGATELSERNFAELLLWEADRADVDPARFEASFNEEVLAAPATRIVSGNLARLRDAGVALTITNFGTGAITPKEVRKLGASGVMLDRALLRGLGKSEGQTMLVSLLALARREGLAVAADGVASGEALAQLARLGCDRARGPGLGRTMPLAECSAGLARAIPLWNALPPMLHAHRR